MREQKIFAGVVVCVTLLMSAAAFADGSSTNYHGRSSVTRHQVSSDAAPNGDNELGFQVGPSIGSANFSVAQGQTTPDADSRTRPALGMFYEHRFAPMFSVRPELNYVQRGFSMTQGSDSSDYAGNYLELPILAKAQYQIGSFTPYVLTGPFLGFLIGKGETDVVNGKSKDTSLDNTLNTFNFGWNFGLGSSYALTRTMSAELGIRYSMAFTNVLSNTQTNSDDSIKLNAFQILGGLGFAI